MPDITNMRPVRTTQCLAEMEGKKKERGNKEKFQKKEKARKRYLEAI
jgi:hypothetical protein